MYMDNFYTSPGFLLDLLEKKILACGTIRSHVQGFPRTRANELSEKAQRGSICWIREGKLLFVRWMDTNMVSMCSTIHKPYDGATVSRRVRNPKKEWEKRQITTSATARDYNKYIGGVDLSDALIGYYTRPKNGTRQVFNLKYLQLSSEDERSFYGVGTTCA